MDSIKMIAIVLIVAGGAALAYGGFTYTKNTQEAKLGSIELNVKSTETVNIPVWVGIAAVAAGSVLLLAQKK